MRIRYPLQRFEGFREGPYLCSGHKWTIGYGTTYYPGGRLVRPDDPYITQTYAWTIAVHQLRTYYIPAVLKACPRVTSPRRLVGLVSFTYNMGPAALMASTMRRRVNEGDWVAAARECLRWNKAGGRVVRGLTLRREVEAAMLLHPDFVVVE